ncbi:MAG: hypothetical protein PHN72_06485 [Bacilli bacterium]|nr:hypothetical protein [Bacilli bacterium]
MNKKYIYLMTLCILSIFSLTGCDADYTITLKNQKIEDNLYLNTSIQKFIDQTATDEGIDKIADNMYDFEDGYKNFQKNFYYNTETAGYKYANEMAIDTTSFTSIASQCYEDVSIENDGQYLIIQTSKKFLCYKNFPDLKSVNITLKSNYTIADANADKMTENELTWNIKKEEQNDRILYAKIEIKKALVKEKSTFDFSGIFIVVGALLIITVLYFLIKKRKQNNSF